MTIAKPELLAELNGDLAREYSARMQYEQHAAVVEEGYAWIAEELLSHADDEGRHARALNDLISYHGGIPVAVTGQVFTASDSARMLTLDLDGENEAIARYKARIKQAIDIGEYGIVSVLIGILADEEHHANDLESALGTR